MTADITVLICIYNRPEYLPAVLETVAQQSLQPAEILIIDDGSSSPIEVESNDTIRVIRHDRNRGAAAARNTGIKAARSSFIALLDTDDSWQPDKLARQYELLSQADTDVFGVFTAFRRIGRDMRAGCVRMPHISDWRRFFLMGIRSGPGSTLMFRRSACLESALFDENLRRYEDWDWLMNVTQSGKCLFLYIDDPLADVLLSGRPTIATTSAALDCIERHHLPRLHSARDRRLFRAAVAVERAAIARWAGRYVDAFFHCLTAVKAPEVVIRELRLTLNIS